MPPANYAKGATTTRPSNLADTYYNTYTANTGVTLNRSLYDVHHIRPLAYGGSNAYSNLIHLPKATHTQVTSWWAGYKRHPFQRNLTKIKSLISQQKSCRRTLLKVSSATFLDILLPC